ncbi:hypothetical protein [Kaistia nematophila]|uniref:Uncharacterized protein n=1 Tax=Kaistia nematophila TaxID=2994654 RepID=A0A9X3E5E2_9HYPH|nr:hypothetical protein [Kaistia nematophila]MCX5571448.1 hypothetical protein [Kaistia nematophila]
MSFAKIQRLRARGAILRHWAEYIRHADGGLPQAGPVADEMFHVENKALATRILRAAQNAESRADDIERGRRP